jgi:uncharacterized coiled-coil protein SlyX
MHNLRVLASTAKEGNAGASTFHFKMKISTRAAEPRTVSRTDQTDQPRTIFRIISSKWKALEANLRDNKFEDPGVKKLLSRLENAPAATRADGKPTIFSRAGEMVRNFRAHQREFAGYYARISELDAEIATKNAAIAELEAKIARTEAEIAETKKSIALSRERLAQQEQVDRLATDTVRALGFPIGDFNENQSR